jgi:hypothetical protein
LQGRSEKYVEGVARLLANRFIADSAEAKRKQHTFAI